MEGLQDLYLDTIDLLTPENINLYNKEIVGLPESDRYDLTRSKCTEFYQELEDSISTFRFKSAVLIVIGRDAGKSRKSSCTTHPSNKSWWTHTVK